MISVAIRRWSEIQNLTVYIPTEGRVMGQVEDFYFKAGSGAIYALLVRNRIEGKRVLSVIGIQAIEKDRVTITNSQMLTRMLPPLPQGDRLRGSRVLDEKGDEVGTVGDIWLAVDRPSALHIASFELAGKRNKTVSADEVIEYSDDGITVYDRTARYLR
ncbi:MAG: PRC-barrel domain-containing protein [Ktedonobacteraceae bacterium]|nr:PRC-barrel domain-containing protein [Ktedonobacteraceae bacterium]